jgi:hypothetical protein
MELKFEMLSGSTSGMFTSVQFYRVTEKLLFKKKELVKVNSRGSSMKLCKHELLRT